MAIKQSVKDFGNKMLTAAAPLGLGGEIVGQASEFAVRHPYGAGLVGGLIGAGIGATGAIIHQRGVAKGQHDALNKNQFKK